MDADDLVRLQRGAEMKRYFGDGHRRAEHEPRTWLDWYVGMWEMDGYSIWAADRKPEGRLIGWVGVSKVWGPPELVPSSELGWHIEVGLWGRGPATEAALAAMRFAFDALVLPRVIARYNVENVLRHAPLRRSA
jgi:RimJ/RimL family protein N-acetyltransferase